MFKKSVDAIRRNKIILIWLLILVVFFFLAAAARTEISSKVMNDYINDNDHYNYMITVYADIALQIVEAIFIIGPFMYLCYLGAMDKAQKGWYKRGMLKGLTIVLPMYALIWLINPYVTTWLYNLDVYREMGNYLWSYVMVGAKALIRFPFIFMMISLVAEKNILTGFKNIVKVGRKYFFAFALLYFFTYVSSLAFAVLLPYSNYAKVLSYINRFIAMGGYAIALWVMYLVGMNMYVTKRADMMEIENKNNIDDGEKL